MQRSPGGPQRLLVILALLRLLIPGSLVFSDDCGTADLPVFPASEPDLDELPAILPNHHAITYRCRPGFKRVHSRLNTTTCTEGVWSPIQDICGRSCPLPPILNNAEIKDEFKSLRDFPVGKVIEYVCHQETDKIPTITITCDKNYKWSEPKVFCKVIMCEDPVVEHGIKLSGFGHSNTYGNNITFECKNGYFMIGSYLIRCQEDSTWYPEVPSCKKIDPKLCGAPLIPSGTVHPLQPQYNTGIIASVTCNPHYSFPDETMEMTAVCRGYNVWDPPVQPCVFRTSEDTFQLSIRNGRIIHGKKKDYEPGDSVTIKCYAGYTLVGSSEIRYIGGNQWSPTIPSCSLSFLFVLLIAALDKEVSALSSFLNSMLQVSKHNGHLLSVALINLTAVLIAVNVVNYVFFMDP